MNYPLSGSKALSKYHDNKVFAYTVLFLLIVIPLCFGVESSNRIIYIGSWIVLSILSTVSIVYISRETK